MSVVTSSNSFTEYNVLTSCLLKGRIGLNFELRLQNNSTFTCTKLNNIQITNAT